MLLEQVDFLKAAIESSSEEILEEISLIREGGDVGKSVDVIEAIILDLLKSSKSESVFSEVEEGTSISEETSDDDHLFKFKVGEKVIISDPFWQMTSELSLKELAYSKPLFDSLCRFAGVGDCAFVVFRKKIPRADAPVYVIHINGKEFAILEHGLQVSGS